MYILHQRNLSMHDQLLGERATKNRLELLPPLRLNNHYLDSVPEIERWIKQKNRGSELRILEAGCGALWPLKLEGTPYKLTAVDIDVHALERRKTKVRDVDDIRVGDLRTPTLFPPASFDVIYNSFVLEHIDGAEQVLDHFLSWLAPGGLLILRVPDRDSVYGFLTRISPFWLHVLYKKYVQGMRDAGQPGHGPYRTFHDEIVSRHGIHQYCASHNCTVRYEAGFSDYLPKNPMLRLMARTLVQSISILSLGRLDWRYNNLTCVIER
jgi:SAM-dependent methyltransferase